MPPGGFNHRRSQLHWLRTVYPSIPAAAFEAVRLQAHNSDNVSIPLAYPDVYECTVGPGDIVVLPAGFWHATVNVGHSIALGFSGCVPPEQQAIKDGQQAALAVARRRSGEPWPWVPPLREYNRDTNDGTPNHSASDSDATRLSLNVTAQGDVTQSPTPSPTIEPNVVRQLLADAGLSPTEAAAVSNIAVNAAAQVHF